MFHTYFETAHCLTAESLANMYRFQYRKASDKESLEKELNFFFETTEHPQILEVFTPTYENDGLLKNYFKALK